MIFGPQPYSLAPKNEFFSALLIAKLLEQHDAVDVAKAEAGLR